MAIIRNDMKGSQMGEIDMLNDDKKIIVERTERRTKPRSNDISVIADDQEANQIGNLGSNPQRSAHPNARAITKSGGHELTRQESDDKDVHMNQHTVMKSEDHGSNPPKTSGERRREQSSGKVVQSRNSAPKKGL
jgi:hypothetical protein